MAEYIEREALDKAMKFITDLNCPSFVAAYVHQIIGEAPAADVRPERHGKWIYLGVDHDLRPWQQRPYQCSCCGWKGKSTNFCLNCGAKMDGKDGD